ncbi:AidA/PixA family protein [Silvibacterium sp.]|uniref:AidA/PixA family protein n=1 Tax=Silvibacterium sp. TaxID=1964179 RepID=UPI0039E2F83E
MNEKRERPDSQNKPGQRAVWLLVVVDTDSVRAQHPIPSQDPQNPTAIRYNDAFLLANRTASAAAQQAEEPGISPTVNGTVHAFAKSGSHNFEDAVLIYGMSPIRRKGEQLSDAFHCQKHTKLAVVPDSPTEPLPIKLVEEVFACEVGALTVQAEGYNVRFALYTRDEETGQPVLNGYFDWNSQESS